MPEKDHEQSNGEITVADLYPGLSPKELSDAEYRLHRYLRAARSVFEHIAKENPTLLTELKRRAMLRKKRANL